MTTTLIKFRMPAARHENKGNPASLTRTFPPLPISRHSKFAGRWVPVGRGACPVYSRCTAKDSGFETWWCIRTAPLSPVPVDIQHSSPARDRSRLCRCHAQVAFEVAFESNMSVSSPLRVPQGDEESTADEDDIDGLALGFPFGFLGADGRLPKARRGRFLNSAIHHHQGWHWRATWTTRRRGQESRTAKNKLARRWLEEMSSTLRTNYCLVRLRVAVLVVS